MARTALTIQQSVSSGLEATYTAADATDGHAINNATGDIIIHVKNGGGGDTDCTIDIPLTVDGVAVTAKTVTVTAGEERFIGPFKQSIYNQDDSEGDTGITAAVFIDFDVETSVTLAAIKVKPV